jgi:multiple sugar transport system permease protein
MTVGQIPEVAERPRPSVRTRAAANGDLPRTSMTARRHRAFYLFTSPWIIGFLLLTVGPMAYALWLSFTTFDGISPNWRYVGFANYRELLSDSVTWASLSRAGVFAITSVPLSIIAGPGGPGQPAAQGARPVPHPALPAGRGPAGGRGSRLQAALQP